MFDTDNKRIIIWLLLFLYLCRILWFDGGRLYGIWHGKLNGEEKRQVISLFFFPLLLASLVSPIGFWITTEVYWNDNQLINQVCLSFWKKQISNSIATNFNVLITIFMQFYNKNFSNFVRDYFLMIIIQEWWCNIIQYWRSKFCLSMKSSLLIW